MLSLLKKRKIHPSLMELLLSLPKTIWFNFRVLPFKEAIKLPFFVSYHVKIRGVNKKTFICTFKNAKTFMSRIGIAGSGHGYINTSRSAIYIKDGGKIIIEGAVGFSRNIYLEAKGGTIRFGDGVKTNVNCHISSENSLISIGNDTVFGWDCCVKNCDGHHIIYNGERIKNNEDIIIGNHCWICSHSTILKGGFMADDCILAYGSILTKKISEESHLLFGGYPARIIKEHVDWVV